MSDLDLDALASQLMSRIKAMGSSSSADLEDADLDYDGRGKVPMHRFRRVLDERNQAREQIGTLAQQVEALQAGYGQQLEALKAQAAEQVANIGRSHQQDLALVESGIRDPLGRKAVREAWEAQPKDSRGKTPVEWWQSVQAARAAHVSDPEANAAPTVPATLVGYLPTLEAPAPSPAPASRGRAAPPAGPSARAPSSIDAVPVDQGMDAFFAGLSGIVGSGG